MFCSFTNLLLFIIQLFLIFKYICVNSSLSTLNKKINKNNNDPTLKIAFRSDNKYRSLFKSTFLIVSSSATCTLLHRFGMRMRVCEIATGRLCPELLVCLQRVFEIERWVSYCRARSTVKFVRYLFICGYPNLVLYYD